MTPTQTKQLLDVGRELTRGGRLNDLLQHAVRAARELVQGDRGALALQTAGGAVHYRSGLDRTGQRVEGPLGHLGETLCLQVLESGESLLQTGPASDVTADRSGTDQLESVLAVPIVARGDMLGVLCVQKRRDTRDLGQDDVVLVEVLATLTALAIDNARRSEGGQASGATWTEEPYPLNDRLQAQNRDRRLSTEISRFRLDLWEFAATEPLEAVMRRALDEICDVTASPIGFYHFVDSDQRTLSLQAWSTRTRNEFCNAAGEGAHYPIGQAGVWVEAFHQRAPVIHNDYASLPHKKGLPDGHAKVIRQLVVPVLRDERVVSILGVGNKPSDYDETDVKLVSRIADLVWSIVDHKRAGEEIGRLNERLETLAMTDELTGILNRRALFQRGQEQFDAFRRYQATFAVLALDLDAFKLVNDAHGHDVGDLALKCFTDAVRGSIRSTDIFARLGGEEFCILLPHANARSAVAAAAEKLRRAVEARPCSIDDEQTVGLTVSIGVAMVDADDTSFESVLKRADRALYQAKEQGRNQVVFPTDGQ